MSIKIMSAIWDGGPKGSTMRFVLIALADNANDDGECWPSVATVARKTGLCERAVRQALRQLEVGGWLKTKIGGGRGGANRYVINPAQNAPGTTCPPAPNSPPPRHDVPPPPAPHAPEPSLNHQFEPSLFGEVTPKPKRRRPECELPQGWVPNERNISDAQDKGFSAKDIEDEADRFRNHHAAKGSRFRDWNAAWRTWIGNAVKFRGKGFGSDTHAKQIAFASRAIRSPSEDCF